MTIQHTFKPLAIPLLLLISLSVYMLMQLIPGGPLAAYQNNPNISAEDLARLKHDLGLDVPKWRQYLNWLSNIVRGVSGQGLRTLLHVNELAREVNLGPKGAQVNLSFDDCTYALPEHPEATVREFVLEIESHGVPRDVILHASDWVLAELGGREAAGCKYARGLRAMGKL